MRRRLAALLAGILLLSGCNLSLNRCLPLDEGKAPGADRLGVTVDVDPANALQEAEVAFSYLEQAGITRARVPFSWAKMQPSRDTLDWRATDAVVEAARRHGVRLQVVLKDTAPWASQAPFVSATAKVSYPPANYTDWFRFVLLVAARYEEAVSDWEIWAGIDRYRDWAGRPEQYMQLLGLAHKAITLTNPQARIIMGGLTLAGDRDRKFLETSLRDRTFKLAEVADAVAFQPGPASPGELRERLYGIRRDLRTAGLELPILVTEVGWNSDRLGQGPCDDYQGGEIGQARYAREIIPWLIELGAERVYWQALWDGAPGTETASMGLIDRQLQAKPILGTLAGLADPSRIGAPTPGLLAPPSEATAVPASETLAAP